MNNAVNEIQELESILNILTPKKRGRPKGSKNKNIIVGNKFNPLDYVKIWNDGHEKMVRERYYDETSKTWISNCGHFKIRYGRYFLGIDLQEKCYKLMMRAKNNVDWCFPKGKYNFNTLRAAVRKMLRVDPTTGNFIPDERKHDKKLGKAKKRLAEIQNKD